jgi:hypothetical protein
MSPMFLLLALLVVAYIGSRWASERGARSFGSPSGIEYVVLGMLLGPYALDLLGNETLHSFEPVAHVALGWIALSYGLECGMLGDTPARLSHILLGIAFTAVTACTAAAGVYWAASLLGLPGGNGLLLWSGALGLVSAETTRHALRWVAERHIAHGALSDLVAELAAADDAFVMMGLAFLFAVAAAPTQMGDLTLPLAGVAIGTLFVGLVLGGATAWLVSLAPRQVEWWTLLLGASFIAIGATIHLGLSAMAATFSLGLGLSVTSPHATRLRSMIGNSEGSVLLPALLLAGAHVKLPSTRAEALIVAVAIAARVVSNVVTGTLIAVVRKTTRPATPWLGLGMLSSGTLTMMVGFALLLRFPEGLGRVALLVAAIGTLLGELIGPFALRRALTSAGEISERDPSSLPKMADLPAEEAAP